MAETFHCVYCFASKAKEGDECEASPTGYHGKEKPTPKAAEEKHKRAS